VASRSNPCPCGNGSAAIPWVCDDVTHSYVWRDSFIRVTWLIHTCDVTHFVRVSWLIPFDVTRSHAWRDSIICLKMALQKRIGSGSMSVPWPMRACGVTYLYVWRDWLINVTLLIPIRDMAHFYKCASLCGNASAACAVTYAHVWRDSFMRVTPLTYTCEVTHWHICKWPCGDESAAMEWLRLVRSLQLYVSFAEYGLFYKALVQKRPIIWRSLLLVATPYSMSVPWWIPTGDVAHLDICTWPCNNGSAAPCKMCVGMC